jgi:transcriptional regulator of acetoin/glycerol metabolism
MPIRTNYRQIDGILGEAAMHSTSDLLALPDMAKDEPEPPRPTADDVRQALAANDGKVAAAARAIGLSRQALCRLMDAFGITRQD